MTLVPAATTYANKKDAYIYIEYPGIGLTGDKAVKFKGFLTEYTDTVTANWNKEELLQRNDMIATYKNTTRTVSIGWSVPCNDEADAKLNLQQNAIMMRMLYGSYAIPPGMPAGGEKNLAPGTQILQQPPLLKVRFANLLKEKTGEGLYVVVSSFSFSPDLEAGFFDSKSGQFYPKSWSLSLEGDVLHASDLGWTSEGTWRGEKTFPFLAEEYEVVGSDAGTATGGGNTKPAAETPNDGSQNQNAEEGSAAVPISPESGGPDPAPPATQQQQKLTEASKKADEQLEPTPVPSDENAPTDTGVDYTGPSNQMLPAT